MNLELYKKSPVGVFYAEIGEEMAECVDARELHAYLESGQDFSNWISNRIEKYEFTEGQEFSINLLKTSEEGGRPKKEYTITVEMAKELCMVENNPKGRAVRAYFISAEKEIKKQVAKVSELEANTNILLGELNKKIVSEHKSKKTIKKLEDIALDASMKPEMVDKLLKVMSLRNKGLNNQLIAAALGVSVSNVENLASKLIGMGAIEPMAYSKQAALFFAEA